MKRVVPRRNLIIDIGAEKGTFAQLLKKRYPLHEVRAIGREPKSRLVIMDTMGNHFYNLKDADANRIHSVWLNHIEIVSTDEHREFNILAQKVPAGVPIIVTVRKENSVATKFAIEDAGLKIIREQDIANRPLVSRFSKEYLEAAKTDPELKPVRLFAIKPKQKK
ncbi:MAG: hypothetical protein NTY48_07590 [Candidatus Diapherotrites archaeon]|nr:hypothetical protein [Candidatus Diapherotrites archaeon]